MDDPHTGTISAPTFGDKVLQFETGVLFGETVQVRLRLDRACPLPELLQQWLNTKALEYLPQHLDYVSAKLKLPYNSVSIKHQRTRWGSCSIKRNINLNQNLMLMPFELLDYVIHHELAHLKIMNHSSKFWKELSRTFPLYKASLAQLKDWEDKKLPMWASV